MGMAKKMKEKAIPATSAKRSSIVVKRVYRADIVELSRSMEPIIRQNEIERRLSSDEISRDTSLYGNNSNPKELIKKLH